MTHADPVPDGSIYFWCYRQGLRGVPFDEVVNECRLNYKDMREKDIQNYWNGCYNRDARQSSINGIQPVAVPLRDRKDLSAYRISPYRDMPENEMRYVPCSQDNRPLIKWGQGCMTYESARATTGCVYLAENMRNTHRIVIDCDGDHDDDNLDLDTVAHLIHLFSDTHALFKPKLGADYNAEYMPIVFADTPMSFHLTFFTDLLIPTMHFPSAHIDIIGNERNSLRYFKNKRWNGNAPIFLTQDIWSYIMDWVEYREERR